MCIRGHTRATRWLGEAPGPRTKPGDCGSVSLSAPPRLAGCGPCWVCSTCASDMDRTGVCGEYVERGNSSVRGRQCQDNHLHRGRGPLSSQTQRQGCQSVCPGRTPRFLADVMWDTRVPRLARGRASGPCFSWPGHAVPPSCLALAGQPGRSSLTQTSQPGCRLRDTPRQGAEEKKQALCAICLPGDLLGKRRVTAS